MRGDRRSLEDWAAEVHAALLRTYGPQSCNLSHEDPLQLLVATILSAQCTDKMVNSITGKLFKGYPDAKAFASAKPEELERMVKPCGYYRAKAAHIIGACAMIVSDFGGTVPGCMDSLTKLPGVGRKTANVVLGDAFGLPGFAVDTHVKRLSNLIGLVSTQDPEKIEGRICGALKPELWNEFSHLLIIHGRRRCPARRPDCESCEILSLCRHGQKKAGRK